jgi:hypothetical protein
VKSPCSGVTDATESQRVSQAGRTPRQPSVIATPSRHCDQHPGSGANQCCLIAIFNDYSKKADRAKKAHQANRHQEIRFHSTTLEYENATTAAHSSRD